MSSNIPRDNILPTVYVGGRDDGIFDVEPPVYPEAVESIAEAIFSLEKEPSFFPKRLKIEPLGVNSATPVMAAPKTTMKAKGTQSFSKSPVDEIKPSAKVNSIPDRKSVV